MSVQTNVSNVMGHYQMRGVVTQSTNHEKRETTLTVDVQIKSNTPGAYLTHVEMERAIRVNNNKVIFKNQNFSMANNTNWQSVGTLQETVKRDVSSNPKSISLNISLKAVSSAWNYHHPGYMNVYGFKIVLDDIVNEKPDIIKSIPTSARTGENIPITVGDGRLVVSYLEYLKNNDWVQVGQPGWVNHTLNLPHDIISSSTRETTIQLRLRSVSLSTKKQVGSPDLKYIRISLPNDLKPFKPSLTVVDENNNSRTLTNGAYFIQGVSIPKFTAKSSPTPGAINESYTIITPDGPSVHHSDNGTLHKPNKLEANNKYTYSILSRDSRGIASETTSVVKDVIPYYAPDIRMLTVNRTSGDSSKLGVALNVQAAPLVFSSRNNNSLTVLYRHKLADAATWSAYVNFPIGTNVISYNNTQVLRPVFDKTKSYMIEFLFQDKFSSLTRTIEVGTESVLMSFNKTKVGVGVVADENINAPLQVGNGGVHTPLITGLANASSIRFNNGNNGNYPLPDPTSIQNLTHYDGKVDMNTYTTKTRFSSVDKPTNAPYTNQDYHVLNMFQSTTTGSQIAIEKSTGKMYVRTKFSNWRPWQEIATSPVGVNTWTDLSGRPPGVNAAKYKIQGSILAIAVNQHITTSQPQLVNAVLNLGKIPNWSTIARGNPAHNLSVCIGDASKDPTYRQPVVIAGDGLVMVFNVKVNQLLHFTLTYML